MWSVCADLYSMDNENEEYFGSWKLSVVGFVCSQIVAPVLNYEKQQPGGALNFHKTITAF